MDGSGVLVGDLFVTAGHVVDMGIKTTVVIEGKTYSLDKDNVVLFDTNPDKRSDGYDIAVFRLNDVCSPLKLADVMPNEGKELLSCSIKHITRQTANIFNSNKENWIFEQCSGKVIARYDNYFECQFSEPISEGGSGSPVFDGEKVIGILYGDKEGKKSSNTVLFLSSKAIVKLLNENECKK